MVWSLWPLLRKGSWGLSRQSHGLWITEFLGPQAYGPIRSRNTLHHLKTAMYFNGNQNVPFCPFSGRWWFTNVTHSQRGKWCHISHHFLSYKGLRSLFSHLRKWGDIQMSPHSLEDLYSSPTAGMHAIVLEWKGSSCVIWVSDTSARWHWADYWTFSWFRHDTELHT